MKTNYIKLTVLLLSMCCTNGGQQSLSQADQQRLRSVHSSVQEAGQSILNGRRLLRGRHTSFITQLRAPIRIGYDNTPKFTVQEILIGLRNLVPTNIITDIGDIKQSLWVLAGQINSQDPDSIIVRWIRQGLIHEEIVNTLPTTTSIGVSYAKKGVRYFEEATKEPDFLEEQPWSGHNNEIKMLRLQNKSDQEIIEAFKLKGDDALTKALWLLLCHEFGYKKTGQGALPGADTVGKKWLNLWVNKRVITDIMVKNVINLGLVGIQTPNAFPAAPTPAAPAPAAPVVDEG